jgi:hypothetical protein
MARLQSEIEASVEGVGVGLFTKQGFREPIIGFHGLLR